MTDRRVPAWVIEGVDDIDIADEVLTRLLEPSWDSARVLADRDVTPGQRAVYFLARIEWARASGGFARVMTEIEPVALLMAMEVAPALDLHHFAGLLKQAIHVVFPDGLPHDEAEEEAGWARFEWTDDGYDVGDAFAGVDEAAREADVLRPLAAYVSAHPDEFFIRPASIADDLRDRLAFVELLLHDDADTDRFMRAERLLQGGLAEADEVGEIYFADTFRERLDRVAKLAAVPRERVEPPELRPLPPDRHVRKVWRRT